jgi:hypothetical protein
MARYTTLSKCSDIGSSNISIGQGRVMGATITIPSEYGLILVAILALFVRWAGSNVWGIICFILHQSFSTLDERDGLHYQHQAILRNDFTELSVLRRLIELALAWRRSTTGIFRRSIPLLLIAVLHLAAFYAAGIFSSRVTTKAGEVLIKSDVCGWPDERSFKEYSQWNQDDLMSADAAFLAAHSRSRKGAAYARSCYGDETQRQSSPCRDYVIELVESKVNREALCPFAEAACVGPAIEIDSGHLDSNTHLGINAPSKDRVQFRKITTCSPLPAEEKYGTNWTTEKRDTLEQVMLNKIGLTILLPGDSFRYYYMGNSSSFGTTYSDITFAISNYTVGFASQPYNLQLVMIESFSYLVTNLSLQIRHCLLTRKCIQYIHPNQRS